MLRWGSVLLVGCGALWGQQYRAFWSDGFHPGFKTPAEVDRMIEHLVQAKANAVFFQARRRGDSYYFQSKEPFTEDATVAAGFDPMEYLIQKAHARGIEVHAWFVVYPSWAGTTMPKDPNHVWNRHGPNTTGRDNWVNYTAAGTRAAALDPGHPDVVRYLVDVFLEPVRRYPLDGIHLDYVRYPEDADYGYNPAAVERFNLQENRAGVPQRTDPRWSEWRRRQVTSLVRQLYLRVQEVRPSVKVSAALITWGNGPLNDAEFQSKDAYSRVFQDWRGWLEEGILDLGMPMNYFRETSNAAFLDRWTDYQKNRQYRRGLLNGLGNYLNTIPETVQQVERVLAPSPSTGAQAMGVCFYSYSATASGIPEQPNPEFYATIAEKFGDAGMAPELPWKVRPPGGSFSVALTVENGALWMVDGTTVRLSGAGAQRVARTDASGFTGWVDVPPGSYTASLERNGVELWRSPPQSVEVGKITMVSARLREEQLTAVLPEIQTDRVAASPGDIVRVGGRRLAQQYGYATGVPLPQELSGTAVLVNGALAPLFEINGDFVEFQVPYAAAPRYDVVVRRDGMDSVAVPLTGVAATPVARGTRRTGDYLEVYATGLGLVAPPLMAGIGGAGFEPFARTVLPVKVLMELGGRVMELDPVYSGLTPYYPGWYQVNVALPQGASGGTVRVRAGDAVSNPVTF